mmetsp:Transcript_23656/g.49274  ORF Transcript_23656/g.49274 Transcript_23656/m.49274 type:complete len:200 (-) Transcript_23656:192-791(-)
MSRRPRQMLSRRSPISSIRSLRRNQRRRPGRLRKVMTVTLTVTIMKLQLQHPPQPLPIQRRLLWPTPTRPLRWRYFGPRMRRASSTQGSKSTLVSYAIFPLAFPASLPLRLLTTITASKSPPNTGSTSKRSSRCQAALPSHPPITPPIGPLRIPLSRAAQARATFTPPPALTPQWTGGGTNRPNLFFLNAAASSVRTRT